MLAFRLSFEGAPAVSWCRHPQNFSAATQLLPKSQAESLQAKLAMLSHLEIDSMVLTYQPDYYNPFNGC